MNDGTSHDLFAELIGRHQNELYAYIFGIVRNWDDADDLFQSVCVVLWQKFDSFRLGSDFFAWARQTAKFKVRQFLAQKHLPGQPSDELIDEIGETIVAAQNDYEERDLASLDRCREKLGSADQHLLKLHYVDDLSTRQISKQLQRSQPSICNSLNRIRCRLLECLQLELAQQEHSREH